MGRRNKSGQDKFRQEQARKLDSRHIDVAADEYVQPSKALKPKAKPPRKCPESSQALVKIAEGAHVEETVDDDSFASDLEVPRRLRGSIDSDVFRKDLSENIQRLAMSLVRLGDPEDVEDFFMTGSNTEGNLTATRKYCQIIARCLRQFANVGESQNQIVPNTIDHYKKHMVYRDPHNMIMILGVIDAFKGITNYQRRKSIGFTRKKGSSMPLNYAISGPTDSIATHPRMLSSNVWVDEVMCFAKSHGFKFKRARFERRFEDGTFQAAHIEPMLMLHIGRVLVEKYLKVRFDTEREYVGKIWLLRDVQNLEFEIVLNKAPCRECKRFQAIFQKYSGITFTYVLMENLAEVSPDKDSNGLEIYPKYAPVESDEIEEVSQYLLDEDITQDEISMVRDLRKSRPLPPRKHRRSELEGATESSACYTQVNSMPSALNRVEERQHPSRQSIPVYSVSDDEDEHQRGQPPRHTTLMQYQNQEPSTTHTHARGHAKHRPARCVSETTSIMTTSKETSYETSTKTCVQKSSSIQKRKKEIIRHIRDFSFPSPAKSPKKSEKALDPDYQDPPSKQLARITYHGSRPQSHPATRAFTPVVPGIDNNAFPDVAWDLVKELNTRQKKRVAKDRAWTPPSAILKQKKRAAEVHHQEPLAKKGKRTIFLDG